MTIAKTYSCNLCGNQHTPDKLIGLKWNAAEIKEKNTEDCQDHLCFACLTSIQ